MDTRRAKTPDMFGGCHDNRLPATRKSFVSLGGMSSSTEHLDQVLSNLRTSIQEKENSIGYNMTERLDKDSVIEKDIHSPQRSKSWDCLDDEYCDNPELKSIAETIANFEKMAAQRKEESCNTTKKPQVFQLIQQFEGSPKKKRSLPSIPVAKVLPTREHRSTSLEESTTKHAPQRSGKTWEVKPEGEEEKETRRQGPRWFLNLTDFKGKQWPIIGGIREKAKKGQYTDQVYLEEKKCNVKPKPEETRRTSRSSSFRNSKKGTNGQLSVHLTKSMTSLVDIDNNEMDPGLSIRINKNSSRPQPKGILKTDRHIEIDPWEDLTSSLPTPLSPPVQSSTLPHRKKSSDVHRSTSMKDAACTLPRRRVSFKEPKSPVTPKKSYQRPLTGFRQITSSRYRQLVGEGDEAGLGEEYVHPDFQNTRPDFIAYV